MMREVLWIGFLVTLTCASIPYKQLLFKQEASPYYPECVVTHRVVNDVPEQFVKIDIKRFTQQMLPEGYNQTEVFGYGCLAQDSNTKESLGMVYSSPGPILRAVSSTKLKVLYSNNIKGKHLFAIDKTLIMDPYKEINTDQLVGVPVVIHLHGMQVQSCSDGYPGAYVTANGIKGPHYCTEQPVDKNSFMYQHPLLAKQATSWIHDHTIGITRLNVYAGIFGMMIIDPKEPTYLSQVPSKYDIQLVFQDKTFNSSGDLFYPGKWEQEYFGKAIVVNGKVWPVVKLESHQYRVRMLNGCGSRVLKLAFKASATNKNIKFTIVKADSSYLDKPVQAKEVMIFPGERIEMIIDLPEGEVQVVNSANIPYPDGDPVDPETDGKILKFQISEPHSHSKSLHLSSTFTHSRMRITEVDQVRYSVFIEERGHGAGRSLIDGHDVDIPYADFIKGNSYEVHYINLTPDSHPIHIHLTQYQVIQRKSIDSVAYRNAMILLNGPAPWVNMSVIPLDKYFTNTTTYPSATQKALRDIVVVNPNEVLTTRFAFVQPDGSEYPFDVTTGPGYVWHCHILEHQDNSMMLAFRLKNPFMSRSAKLLLQKVGLVLGALMIVAAILISYSSFGGKKAQDRRGLVEASSESHIGKTQNRGGSGSNDSPLQLNSTGQKDADIDMEDE